MSDIFDVLAFSELLGGKLSRKLSRSVGTQVIEGVVDVPIKFFYSPGQLAKAIDIIEFVSCPFKIIYTQPNKKVMKLVGGGFGLLKPAAKVIEQTGALNSLQESVRQGVFGYVYEVGARASVSDNHRGILKEAVLKFVNDISMRVREHLWALEIEFIFTYSIKIFLVNQRINFYSLIYQKNF